MGQMAFQRDNRGLAALEFALIAPFLAILIMGIAEMSLRFRATDEFHRYLQQAGDYLARAEELTSGDIDAIHDAAGEMMKPVHVSGRLHMDVSSIGFTPNGSPELLWRRHRGDEPPDFEISEAAGLGDPGESVIRVGARFTYQSPISGLLGVNTMRLDEAVWFRPRVTRVIAIDGAIADAGADWDNDGQSLEAGT
jgi:hypothetical protein